VVVTKNGQDKWKAIYIQIQSTKSFPVVSEIPKKKLYLLNSIPAETKALIIHP